MHYSYVVLTSSEINSISNTFNNNTLRWNPSQTKCVVKFEGDCPSWAISKPLYNRQQMSKITLSW